MPYKEKEITKLYYTMGDVASMLRVNHSLIRFWEKEFDVLKPKKNKKGNPDELDHNLEIVNRLKGIKAYLLELKQHL